MAVDEQRTYAPGGPVLRAFHRSPAFVRGIRGPIGSGKSTACVMEILRKAKAQEIGKDGNPIVGQIRPASGGETP